FHARCVGQIFDDLRSELISDCKSASPDLTKCAVVKERICRLRGDDADPFVKLCEGDGTDEAMRQAKALRQEACLIDIKESEETMDREVRADCATATHIKAGGASANLWTYTAKESDGTTDLTIRETIERTYDTNDSKTDFWVADKTAEELLTISNSNTAPNSNLAGAPAFNRLDLANTYDDPRGTGRTIGFGGDAEDGAISFRAEWRDGGTTTFKHFAGILPTTNLGAPLVAEAGKPTTATWHGVIVLEVGIGSGSALYQANDLVLTVDFANDIGTIASKPNRIDLFNDGYSGTSQGTLEIDGTFNEYGLLSGTVGLRLNGSISTERTGTLTGLIGAEGVVGAFISNQEASDNPYAGVFVANDNVCGQNPFDVLCGADFKEQRNQVVINCSVESPD
ncbi:MAG: hypothetical protein K8953_01820, partial [Proteobacteria bacterium]|nr:hypothetical protein [Pseudomonadota bacterium]